VTVEFALSPDTMWPGQGGLDLTRFASTLRDRGYDGLVSVEILNEELRRSTSG